MNYIILLKPATWSCFTAVIQSWFLNLSVFAVSIFQIVIKVGIDHGVKVDPAAGKNF